MESVGIVILGSVVAVGIVNELVVRLTDGRKSAAPEEHATD
jgi:hypothetical protein